MTKVQRLKNLVQGGSGIGTAIRQFMKRFDLVYFGHVDHRYDEHAIVRGVTANAQHRDRHFAVGNIKGRDVSIVERSNKLFFPGKGEQYYTWVIIQVDLKAGLEIPHAFFDAHHHDEIFYANLFINFANFHSAQSLFLERDPLFAKRFKAYTAKDRFDELADIMTPEITNMLAHHFSHFDYELQSDCVYVYSNDAQTQEKDIERMARVGLWLADKLEQPAAAQA